MMPPRLITPLTAALLAPILCLPAARAQSDEPRAVLTARAAYVLGPSEPIIGPHPVQEPVFTPAGDALIAAVSRRPDTAALANPADGRPKDSDLSLVHWSRLTRQSRTVWRKRAADGESLGIGDGAWLADGSRFLFRLTRTVPGEGATQELLLLDPIRGTARGVRIDGHEPADITASPTGAAFAVTLLPTAGATSGDARSGAVCVVDATGVVRRTFTVPPRPEHAGARVAVVFAKWDETGERLALHTVQVAKSAEGKSFSFVAPYMADPRDGTVRFVGGEKASPVAARPAPPVDPLPLRLHTVAAPSPPGNGVPAPGVRNVFVDATDGGTDPAGAADRSALVAGDAEGVRLVGTADGSAGVVYRAHGTLLYAPLVRQPRDAFLAARDARLRRRALSNLKQIHSALEQYAFDHKGYPPPGADLIPLLVGDDKYIRRDDGFRDPRTGALCVVYTYDGSPDGGPKPVPLLTMTLPGGRYVATSEGIAWEDGAPAKP